MIISTDTLEFEKKIELTVPGWRPLEIEYVIKVLSNVSWIFWKITNTEHVFQIQYQIVLLNHSGNLQEHFSLVLETFRKDFLEWKEANFPQEWMQKYNRMYSSLIIL